MTIVTVYDQQKLFDANLCYFRFNVFITKIIYSFINIFALHSHYIIQEFKYSFDRNFIQIYKNRGIVKIISKVP